MPVLFKEISEELGLNLVQLGTVWGILSFSGLVCLFAGMLGDRFGFQRIITIACFLTAFMGAFRGFSFGFISLAITSLLFGLFSSLFAINMPKLTRIWFSGRQIGFATSVLSTGMAIGCSLGSMISATVLSPWFGGWRGVFILYGVISVGISSLWLLTVREPGTDQPSTELSHVPMGESLSHVIRLGSVWILGLAFLGYNSWHQGFTGYLSLYLQGTGWSPASSDGALAAFNTAGAFGAIPIAIFSDRLGLRKPVLITVILITALASSLLPFSDPPIVWIIAVMVGFFRDAIFTLFIVMVIENKEVDVRYGGTSLGLAQAISRIGATVAPPLGHSLVGIHPGAPFLFWAVLAVMGVVFLACSAETGWRAGRKMGGERT